MGLAFPSMWTLIAFITSKYDTSRVPALNGLPSFSWQRAKYTDPQRRQSQALAGDSVVGERRAIRVAQLLQRSIVKSPSTSSEIYVRAVHGAGDHPRIAAPTVPVNPVMRARMGDGNADKSTSYFRR
jgi:hypothetical protein